MPSTRFGRPSVDKRGVLDFDSLDWDLIFRAEPEKVGDWLRYSFKYAPRDHFRGLVMTVADLLPSKGSTKTTSTWNALASSGLLPTLMDLASDPNANGRRGSLEVRGGEQHTPLHCLLMPTVSFS